MLDNTEVVIELGMTARQLQTLRWILMCWLRKYEDTESSIYKEDAQAIFDVLEGV